MALRRIAPRRKPLLPVTRAFSSSNPRFPPPPPPPPANDPDAARSPSSFPPPNPEAPRNPASSLFNDIRERLRSSPTPRRMLPTLPLPRPNRAHGAPPAPPLEDIRRLLNNFQKSNAAGGRGGAPSLSTPGGTPSFQEAFRNVTTPGPSNGQRTSFDSIRESLKKVPPQPQRPPRSQKTQFLYPIDRIFNKDQEGGGKESVTLMRSYSYEELGKKLSELRPVGAVKDGKEWFSLEELQGRIAKLVELDKHEGSQPIAGHIGEIRKSLMAIKQKESSAQKPRVGSTMPIMSIIGGHLRPDYMHLPPQEDLFERYFHLDHMSSEEKMKLELQRVRDEFKMSENDCGSARVQIAQLTLKIKHLSAVLHKKDKHSRKGLQEMVQRRKKYLKYLRRTDWDSYCLVLSKLGLRDVPEYKAPDYKSKSTTKAKSKKSKSKSKGRRKMKA